MDSAFNSHQENMSYYHEKQQLPPPPYSQEDCLDQTQIEHNFIQRRTQWIQRDRLESRASEQAFLEKPVVIPRLAVHSMMSSPLPFLRAYAPVLQHLNVSAEDFVAFIDNLAVVQTEPALLQALNIVGTGIGFIPWHWALAVGLAMNASATAGSKIITKKRTGQYLEIVNREYFNPRGLNVLLCKDDDLSALVGCPPSWPKLAPVDRYTSPPCLRDRRMHVLEPYVAPLSLEVPPMEPQEKTLDKISAKLVAHTMAKQEKENIKQRRKFVEGEVTQEELAEQEKEALKKVRKMEYIVVDYIRSY